MYLYYFFSDIALAVEIVDAMLSLGWICLCVSWPTASQHLGELN